MEYEIKRLGPRDAALLSRVADGVFDAEIHPGRLAEYLRDGGHAMVVALAGGEVVGQARGVIHLQPDRPHELYIDNMGVAPALWRRGIGGRLLDEMLDWARERGCRTAWLGTEEDNIEARALYESRGGESTPMLMFAFEEFDRSAGFGPDGGEELGSREAGACVPGAPRPGADDGRT